MEINVIEDGLSVSWWGEKNVTGSRIAILSVYQRRCLSERRPLMSVQRFTTPRLNRPKTCLLSADN